MKYKASFVNKLEGIYTPRGVYCTIEQLKSTSSYYSNKLIISIINKGDWTFKLKSKINLIGWSYLKRIFI